MRIYKYIYIYTYAYIVHIYPTDEQDQQRSGRAGENPCDFHVAAVFFLFYETTAEVSQIFFFVESFEDMIRMIFTRRTSTGDASLLRHRYKKINDDIMISKKSNAAMQQSSVISGKEP